MSENLKLCPFCGSDNIEFGNHNTFIYCANCGAETQIYKNEQDARNAWNIRAYEDVHDEFNPKYYKSRDKSLEAIDYIEAYDLNFNLGNVIKYITRAGSKDGEITQEALNKALWYINREISRLKAKQQEEESK